MTRKERIEQLEAEVANLKIQLAQLAAAPRLVEHYHHHASPTVPTIQPWQQRVPWHTIICQTSQAAQAQGVVGQPSFIRP